MTLTNAQKKLTKLGAEHCGGMTYLMPSGYSVHLMISEGAVHAFAVYSPNFLDEPFAIVKTIPEVVRTARADRFRS